MDTPTTDLLPLLSEAHTARVESEFEDVPEVIAEAPSSPPLQFAGRIDDAETITGAVAIQGWAVAPLSPGSMADESAADGIELYEDDLPELVAEDPAEPLPAFYGPSQTSGESSPQTDGPSLWLAMVEEVVELISEMEEDAAQLRPDQPDSAETCRHVAVRLTLMLARNGVTVIGIKEQGAVESIMGQVFDRARHQPSVMDNPQYGARIVEVISPGFAVGQRILRRARVRCQ